MLCQRPVHMLIALIQIRLLVELMEIIRNQERFQKPCLNDLPQPISVKTLMLAMENLLILLALVYFSLLSSSPFRSCSSEACAFQFMRVDYHYLGCFWTLWQQYLFKLDTCQATFREVQLRFPFNVLRLCREVFITIIGIMQRLYVVFAAFYYSYRELYWDIL